MMNTELLFRAPAATACRWACFGQWRYTEMWRSVRRSPPHHQDAGNGGLYLQQRNKWRKLVSLLTDCGLHANAEATEPEAVSYMDVIKNTQYTREDIYTHEEHVHYQLDFTEL